jgi:hypothetical protein
MEDEREVRRAVASAFAFFDVLGHPLTLLEAWKYRRGAPSATVAQADAAIAALGLGQRDGFFFLPGRASTVDLRAARYRATIPKLRRARRFAAFLRLLPSVRLVAACNSVALTGADDGGDIDLFVVVASRTVWVTRLLVVGILGAFGLRPTDTHHKDRFCMSFFASEDALDLSALTKGDDPYFRYWLSSLVPLYDAGGILDALFAANRTLLEALPGTVPVSPSRGMPGRIRSLVPLSWLRAAEARAKALQLPRLPQAIRERMNDGTDVVVNDGMLKFHTNDRRAAFAAAAAERLATLERTYAPEPATAR